MDLKLHVAGPVIWLRAGDCNLREDFSRPQVARVRPRDKLADGDLPDACRSLDSYRASQNQKQRRRIGMRLGKTKIATQRSRGSYPHIRHMRFHFRQNGLMFLHDAGAFNAAMRRRGPNLQCAVTYFDGIEPGNYLEVDQVAIV